MCLQQRPFRRPRDAPAPPRKTSLKVLIGHLVSHTPAIWTVFCFWTLESHGLRASTSLCGELGEQGLPPGPEQPASLWRLLPCRSQAWLCTPGFRARDPAAHGSVTATKYHTGLAGCVETQRLSNRNEHSDPTGQPGSKQNGWGLKGCSLWILSISSMEPSRSRDLYEQKPDLRRANVQLCFFVSFFF